MCPWLISGERGGSEVFDLRRVSLADEALFRERRKIIRCARALIEHLNRDSSGGCLTKSNARSDNALEEHRSKASV